jgi:hypothetical protein
MLFSSLFHERKRATRRCRRRPRRGRLLLEILESRNLLSGIVNVNTDTQGIAHNETAIAVNPMDPQNLIGSANDYPSRAQDIVNDFGYLHAHVTFNGGGAWTEYPIPFNPDLYDGTSDPAVAFDADGTAYLASLAWHSLPNGDSTAGDMVVAHSANRGRTWSSPVPVFTGTGTFLGAGVVPDKEYITAWGHGNAIVTWTVFYQGPGGTYISSPIFASVTHDRGTTWTAPAQISGPFVSDQFSVPVVAADGSIYVAFDSEDQDVAPQYRGEYRVVKVDPLTAQPLDAPVEVALVYNGVNDYPYNVDGRLTYQDSQFRSWNVGNLTADPTDANHLAVIWSDIRNNPYHDAVLPSADPYHVRTNSDIIISQSFDGGRTWSVPTAIQQPGDQFQPWGAYDADGRLQIGYYDRSYDPANHKYGYTLASEMDSGSLNFSFQQVTTALSDPTQGDAWFTVTANRHFPNATRFLGDYSNIAITPTGVAAYWTDMRLPAPAPGSGSGEDAFFADLSGAGSTATVPAATAAPVNVWSASLPGGLGASENVNLNAPANRYALEIAMWQWLLARQTLAASGSMADSLTLGKPDGSPANAQLDGPLWTDPFAALG